jgi:hypothetical protein
MLIATSSYAVQLRKGGFIIRWRWMTWRVVIGGPCGAVNDVACANGFVSHVAVTAGSNRCIEVIDLGQAVHVDPMLTQ